jgi:hypothetical protein
MDEVRRNELMPLFLLHLHSESVPRACGWIMDFLWCIKGRDASPLIDWTEQNWRFTPLRGLRIWKETLNAKCKMYSSFLPRSFHVSFLLPTPSQLFNGYRGVCSFFLQLKIWKFYEWIISIGVENFVLNAVSPSRNSWSLLLLLFSIFSSLHFSRFLRWKVSAIFQFNSKRGEEIQSIARDVELSIHKSANFHNPLSKSQNFFSSSYSCQRST